MMTTGYDCTDLLNVVLMKPIFSVSDFVQIKGRGTRPHAFKNELTGQITQKDSYHLIDFFGVCEYFEEEYDYKEPLKIPAGKGTSPKPIPEPATDTGAKTRAGIGRSADCGCTRQVYLYRH